MFSLLHRTARPPRERRAFSLIELTAVVAIVGLMSAMALTRWGDNALRTTSAQGFARSLTLSMSLARRQAIAEGTPAAVVVNRNDGNIQSLQVVRAESVGDVPTELQLDVPQGVTVTASSDRWEFNYTGSLNTPVAGGSIGIADGDWNWNLSINALTGHIDVEKAQ